MLSHQHGGRCLPGCAPPIALRVTGRRGLGADAAAPDGSCDGRAARRPCAPPSLAPWWLDRPPRQRRRTACRRDAAASGPRGGAQTHLVDRSPGELSGRPAIVGHPDQSFSGGPQAALASTSRRWPQTTRRRPFKPRLPTSRAIAAFCDQRGRPCDLCGVPCDQRGSPWKLGVR
jgi:hypothetical protein